MKGHAEILPLIFVTLLLGGGYVFIKSKFRKAMSSGDPKRVLVTGGAGFIGHQLALTLAKDSNNFVVVVDNFNDYYDIRLKMDRAYDLHKQGITVYYDDVCNQDFLTEMFVKYNFTHVAHMAAQAGVRYSLENPEAYIRANVECQLALLDTMKHFKHIKLVYASSSSVYGKESEIPFRLTAHTDRPGNMYAATKKTDELFGYHYCEAYGMSMVGLRFFTVYGPWGRPDMAVYKFAEAIMAGKKVPLFHVSDDQELGRDFTYVDDVVAGIIATLDYTPAKCGERFNLGFGHPVSVPGMISILEKELAIPAKLDKLPLPPTEILKTWADISTSTALLGFQPKTDLQKGVREFVVWYKNYLNERKKAEESSEPAPVDKWMASLLADKLKRQKEYDFEHILKENARLRARMDIEAHKYAEWAQETDPYKEAKHSFTFFKGVDSLDGDIFHRTDLQGNIAGMEQACRREPLCVAFNSEGYMKHSLAPRDKWTHMNNSAQTSGLYVAEIDICSGDLHTCSKYAKCQKKDFPDYRCVCSEGFYSSDRLCLPRLGSSPPSDLQTEYDLAPYMAVNVQEMKSKAGDMLFVQGVDTDWESYRVADQHRDRPAQLQRACQDDALCIAITTDGVMKKRLPPRDRWLRWTDDPSKGMFVYDVNFCALSRVSCPSTASCRKRGPADYRCDCPDGYIMTGQDCMKLPPIQDSLLRLTQY